MAPPRSAFGTSPPGGQRQRTGKAGSAASAWLLRVVLMLAGLASPALARDGTSAPHIERAIKGERCVEDVATMRRDHMRMLRHQRDATVHNGIRGTKYSLKGCIECHASPATGSVAQAGTDFCTSCHAYAAVKIDCFECHASRPASKVAATRP